MCRFISGCGATKLISRPHGPFNVLCLDLAEDEPVHPVVFVGNDAAWQEICGWIVPDPAICRFQEICDHVIRRIRFCPCLQFDGNIGQFRLRRILLCVPSESLVIPGEDKPVHVTRKRPLLCAAERNAI